MKAAVVNLDLSLPPVAVRTVDMPTLRPYWALVRVHHAALNRLDAMMLANRSDQPPGAVFGSDGAGVVVELGPAFTPALPQVPGVAVGAEVVISPSLLWGADPAAPGERYEILGSPTRGTHAEYVTVPAANLFPRPAHLSWAEAAALPTAGVTAWRALVTRGRLTGDDTVVIGAGSSGVGTLAIQIASATGARVVAVTSTPDKAAHALKLGAHATVDRTAGPDELASALLEQTGDGASLALDPTGALWPPFVDALRPGGRLVVVGKMAAATARVDVRSVYWKQLDLLGSAMGSTHDFAALLDHVAKHRWAPFVDSVHPLSEVAAAYARLDHPDRVGKVVLDLQQP